VKVKGETWSSFSPLAKIRLPSQAQGVIVAFLIKSTQSFVGKSFLFVGIPFAFPLPDTAKAG
jgi:hypothetical protein